MITSAIQFDLSRDSETQDRRVVGGMYPIAAGARVVIQVGSREFAPPWTVHHLAQYAASLHLDLWGTQRAVEAWTTALLDESGLGRWSA